MIETYTPASLAEDPVGDVEVTTDEDGGIEVAPALPEEVLTVEDQDGGLPSAEVQPVSLPVDDALSQTSSDDAQIATFVDDASATAQYVIPTDVGVQVITAVTAEPASYSREFPINLADGQTTNVSINEDGSAIVTNSEGLPVGTVSAPWAVDANGKSIATHYIVTDGVLSQWVDYATPGIAYPVLSDPNWTYSLTYVIGPKSKVNATKVRAQLYSCFSCNFAADPALSGAPRNMPSKGTVVPLRLGGIGNRCRCHGNGGQCRRLKHIVSSRSHGWQLG